jgi:DNA-binding CsgD family transcriptional regulator
MRARASHMTSVTADADLIALLDAVGTPAYLPRLIDLVAALVPHDRLTVTRYLDHAPPQFLTHRNFSDALVKRYLTVYYLYDPYYAYCRQARKPGIVPLAAFGLRDLKRGRYIAEFLRQSVIKDEVGLLLNDGPEAMLGIFLERATRSLSRRDIGKLTQAFPQLAAIHALQRRVTASAGTSLRRVAAQPAAPVPRAPGKLPDGLWPDLTIRERELVGMILAGHPPQAIAARLGISAGTVRNHRQNIFRKLDITSEREVFLQYLDYLGTP